MELTFQFGNEIVVVRIKGTEITFSNSQVNFKHFFPLENIDLSINGILKEHPDLKGLPKMKIREEGLKRLRKHIKDLGGEEKIKDYVIKELQNQGYILKNIK